MHLAEREKIIHESQYGCRKRKIADDPVMIETMMQEFTRMTQQVYAQINFVQKRALTESFPN
jgi:hypothetical protein